MISKTYFLRGYRAGLTTCIHVRYLTTTPHPLLAYMIKYLIGMSRDSRTTAICTACMLDSLNNKDSTLCIVYCCQRVAIHGTYVE